MFFVWPFGSRGEPVSSHRHCFSCFVTGVVGGIPEWTLCGNYAEDNAGTVSVRETRVSLTDQQYE